MGSFADHIVGGVIFVAERSEAKIFSHCHFKEVKIWAILRRSNTVINCKLYIAINVPLSTSIHTNKYQARQWEKLRGVG